MAARLALAVVMLYGEYQATIDPHISSNVFLPQLIPYRSHDNSTLLWWLFVAVLLVFLLFGSFHLPSAPHFAKVSKVAKAPIGETARETEAK